LSTIFHSSRMKFIQVRQWGRPISTHANPTSTRHTIFHKRRISSVTFTSAHLYCNLYWTTSTTLTTITLWPPNMHTGQFVRFLASGGGQSSSKCVIPCPGRRWTAEQNLTPLALSSIDKFVTAQTCTHKITTKQANSRRYIDTLPIICVDKNIFTQQAVILTVSSWHFFHFQYTQNCEACGLAILQIFKP